MNNTIKTNYLEWSTIMPPGMIPSKKTSLTPLEICGTEGSRILRDWVASLFIGSKPWLGNAEEKQVAATLISSLLKNGYYITTRNSKTENPVEDGLLWIGQRCMQKEFSFFVEEEE